MLTWLRDKRGRAAGVVILCILLITVFSAAIWYWLNRKTPAPHQETAAPKVTARIPSPRVLGTEKIAQDKDLAAMMKKRKERFGIGAGVDMIVKPNESIQVGKVIVPMQEILDKIRLKRGEMIEKDIGGQAGIRSRQHTAQLFRKRIAEAQQEYRDLVKKLANPDITGNPQLSDRYSKRIAELKKTLDLYRRYQALNSEIDRQRAQLGNVTDNEKAKVRIHALQKQKRNLESRLTSRIMPAQDTEAYGIYLVRPGDNIWNVHFKFLRDFFARKGINLSPESDEPNPQGYSSGVGKILKFSENMVYIYNVREHKLDVNLNMIQPHSKIVVFNMGKVLALLNQIDYRNVKHIRFDGETLWIPADQ